VAGHKVTTDPLGKSYPTWGVKLVYA
jgi:hypothetical protein